MLPKNIKPWLLISLLALSVRFCAGLYYLYIGCPRILEECYNEGADAVFWPITISMLTFYISALAVIIIATVRTAMILVRLAKQAFTSKNSN